MTATASQLKARARGHLAGKYAILIMAIIIATFLTNIPSLIVSYTSDPNYGSYYLISAAVSMIVAFITMIFVTGQNYICLNCARDKSPRPLSEMWYGFKGRADDIIKAFFFILLRALVCILPFGAALYLYTSQAQQDRTLALCIVTLLFAVVMLIRLELEYALVFYLLIDRPQLPTSQLLAASRELMNGKKRKLLYLQLSFIGIYLLGILSLGIGLFWIHPYIRMTFAEFYLECIKD